MDLGATKYMILDRVAFDTYKVISPCNMHLSDDIVVKVIRTRSNVVIVEM